MRKNIIRSTVLACALAGVIAIGGTTSEAAIGDRTLSPGMNHSDVKELQQGLRQLNFFTYANNTTYFGSITKEAVQKFQKANGLTVDGYFGPASARVLQSKIGGKPSSTPSRGNSSSSTVSSTGLLKQGSRGASVGSLQQSLSNLGYYKSSIDSIFGGGTKTAVMNFQRSQGIAVDGIVGPATFNSISNAANGKGVVKGDSTSSNNGSSASGIISAAKKYVGHNYVFGGTGPSGFDCSGFTQYIYGQAGVSIPRTTTSQANVGTRLSKSQLKPGDLLVFSNTYKAGPSHVGVYIGDGNFVHAANSRKGVRVDSVNSSYYSSKFTSGRRLF